jgi:HEAT repeat protein
MIIRRLSAKITGLVCWPLLACLPSAAVALINPVILVACASLTEQTAGSAAYSQQPGSSSDNTAVFQQLKSSDAGERAKVVRQLGEHGDRTVLPYLIALVHDPGDKVRREVVIALGAFRDPQALDALTTVSRDSEPDVRTLAVHSLVGYYTGKTPSPGFSGFWQRNWSRAKDFLGPDDSRVDPGVSIEPKVVAALVAVLKDTGDLQSARWAARGLGILMARSASPDLVKSAHSADSTLAQESLNALGKIQDPAAGPGLVDLLDSSNSDIKQQAARTVGLLRTREALPKLAALFEHDHDGDTRQAALDGIADIGDPVSKPLLIRALWNDNKHYRAAAAAGLAHANDIEVRDELQRELKAEKDASVKLALEYALAALGQREFVTPIVEQLKSKTHADAAQKYLTELAQNPEFLSLLYPYLTNRDVEIRRRVCTVLVFRGNQSSIAPLERASHDTNEDVADEALRALRAVRARNATA